MKWTVRKIRDYRQEVVAFDEVLKLHQSIVQRDHTIIQLAPVEVKGYFVVREDAIIMHCQVQTEMTLPSTRTLEEVTVPLDFWIRERYVDSQQGDDASEYDEITFVLEQEWIDLEEIVLESLLLNKPLRVVSTESDDSLPKGKDWEMLTEEAYHQIKACESTVDPRFEKLKSLLNEEKDTESSQSNN